MRLSERLDSRDNNLGLLRLLAAFFVLFGHSFTLRYSVMPDGPVHDPIGEVIFPYMAYGQGLPGLGVHIFFFISGLLVTRSFMRNDKKPFSFIASRCLRLFPAYWVNLLLITFVLAPIVTTLPLRAYFEHPDTWAYLWRNFFLHPMYMSPAEIFQELPFAKAVNGSMWTLPIEGQMYIWCLGLGLIGLYRRAWLFLAFVVAAVMYHQVTGKDPISMTRWGESRLWLFFFLGGLACVFANHIRINLKWLALLAIPLPVIYHFVGHVEYAVYCAAYTGYVCLYLSFAKYWRAIDISRVGDFSYGVYLYAFPVQQTLMHYTRMDITGWEVAVYSAIISSLFAVASWYLIEQPALRFKRSKRLKETSPSSSDDPDSPPAQVVVASAT